MRLSPALSEPQDKSGRQTHRWTRVQHAEAGLAGCVSGTRVSSVTGLGSEVQIVQWVDSVHRPCLSSCRASGGLLAPALSPSSQATAMEVFLRIFLGYSPT